jgi:predicted pyridoxine 5'-phosphate oxidase superfamily flavin-nucleotide-binding protein
MPNGLVIGRSDTVDSFHEGELYVQELAGVRAQAQRLAPMLAPGGVSPGMTAFLKAQRLLIITTYGAGGMLWSSYLTGPAGFLDGIGTTVEVQASPAPVDPLAAMAVGNPVGMLAIDFDRRRRLRVNGVLARVDADGFQLKVDQAYGNCPGHITPQDSSSAADGSKATATAAVTYCGAVLLPSHREWIAEASTMFVGSAHPYRGADASHRGGVPGFVRVQQNALSWPDYPGNNLFNTLGNIAAAPRTSMLFLDLGKHRALHLAGEARIEASGRTRGVVFATDRAIEISRGPSD